MGLFQMNRMGVTYLKLQGRLNVFGVRLKRALRRAIACVIDTKLAPMSESRGIRDIDSNTITGEFGGKI
jgi:GTP cyclohydrolase I